jgi:hypothetical protein
MFGSYLTMFGVGMVGGHYHNPFTIVDLVNNGEITGLDLIFYAYVGANIILYGLGIYYQYS